MRKCVNHFECVCRIFERSRKQKEIIDAGQGSHIEVSQCCRRKQMHFT